jgi:cysteine-rich repeat protein
MPSLRYRSFCAATVQLIFGVSTVVFLTAGVARAYNCTGSTWPALTAAVSNQFTGSLSNYTIDTSLPGCDLVLSSTITITFPDDTDTSTITGGTLNGTAIASMTKSAQTVTITPPARIDSPNSITIVLTAVTNPTVPGSKVLQMAASGMFSGSVSNTASSAYTIVLPPTATPTNTPSPSNTPTPSNTLTPSHTPTPTITGTPTQTPTHNTPTFTPTPGPCTLPLASNPCIPGGGTKNTDCNMEWITAPVPQSTKSGIPSNTLVCYEGDPKCDFDSDLTNDSCTFHVQICINNTDPRLACTPSSLKTFEVTAPNPKTLKPTPNNISQAADDINVPVLESQADGGGFGVTVVRGQTQVFVGQPNSIPNVCSPPFSLVVPLKVANNGKPSKRRKTFRIRGTTGLGVRDTDTLKLECRPSTCGDGILQPDHETCDDGNRINGDGCDAGCHLEPATPTPTSTATAGVPTSTPTNTVPAGATSTPTSTPVPSATPTATPVPAATNTPTATSVPTATNTPTATSVSTATNTPTATFTSGPAVCGGISVPASNCCNGTVDAGEQCDDGGTCVGGTNDGVACTANSGCPGGECRAFGGDGCAANCTPETTVHFEFTGAKCQGGTKGASNTECHFIKTCVGGAYPTKPCSANSDCGPTGNQGVCTDECATGSDGSICEGVGACSGGTSPGAACPSAASGTVPPPPVLICQGGTKPGHVCATVSDCPGSGVTCINPCGSGGTCVHKSGAVLTSIGIIGALGIGPLSGGEDLDIGQADANGMVPVAVPAASVVFNPVTVPGLACACPRGIAVSSVHGPGNAAAGFIGCGASGLTNVNVVLSQDHNTNPGDVNNGPGTCSGGTRSGLGCGVNGDCTGGGTCTGKGGGGGLCVSGTNKDKVCHSDGDCPGSICDSPDDATCTAQDLPPPAGSGSVSCLEEQQICTSGPNAGMACTSNLVCGANASCGTQCNALSPHAGICNSPIHLTQSGSGPTGSALVVNSTAIGVITATGDTRPCRRSAVCSGFAFNSTPAACEVNSQCTSPKTCISAYCAGLCSTGAKTGQACIKNTDCGSGQICTPGAQFAQTCTGMVSGECGADGKCAAVNSDKGFDGLPCTDDDPPSSRGNVSTIATTTALAAAGVVDVDDIEGQLMFDGVCTNATACTTSRQGHIFDCTALLSSGVVTDAHLASAFPSLDGNETGDTVVTNGQTGK